MSEADKQKLQEAINAFKSVQGDVAELVQRNQQLNGQYNENKLVQHELDLVNEESIVYKKVGPVLLKQDADEAKESVKRRLDFIKGEMEKLEAKIKSKQEEVGAARQKVISLQSAMQQGAKQGQEVTAS